MLVRKQQRDGGDAEPVQPTEVQTEPDGDKQRDRCDVQQPRAAERSLDTEPRGHGLQPLGEIDLSVEERVKEIEAGDPDGDGCAERPRFPREPTGDRDPAAESPC